MGPMLATTYREVREWKLTGGADQSVSLTTFIGIKGTAKV